MHLVQQRMILLIYQEQMKQDQDQYGNATLH